MVGENKDLCEECRVNLFLFYSMMVGNHVGGVFSNMIGLSGSKNWETFFFNSKRSLEINIK